MNGVSHSMDIGTPNRASGCSIPATSMLVLTQNLIELNYDISQCLIKNHMSLNLWLGQPRKCYISKTFVPTNQLM